MGRVRGLLDRRRGRDRGATAVEYALMVMLITLVVVGAVTTLGERLSVIFDDISTHV